MPSFVMARALCKVLEHGYVKVATILLLTDRVPAASTSSRYSDSVKFLTAFLTRESTRAFVTEVALYAIRNVMLVMTNTYGCNSDLPMLRISSSSVENEPREEYFCVHDSSSDLRL